MSTIFLDSFSSRMILQIHCPINVVQFPIASVSSNRGDHLFVESRKIPRSRRACSSFRHSCFPKAAHVVVGIQDVFHVFQNRVLIAAVVSAAVGQLMKPFASTVLYKKEFDFTVALQSGGFPSTHSSTVIAAATCLGLERGFGDSIFGLAVVYAGLVMYDAQGVRREVGIHAKTLNMALLDTQFDSASSSKEPNDFSNISPPKSRSDRNTSDLEVDGFQRKQIKDALLLEAEIVPEIASRVEEVPKNVYTSSPLKESIGHTELEVIAVP
ncbi:hypothetical protein Leryth_024647 [Lithospermum erythrorhizon]|nr:hypothetical protein Leryth_024647 [Lithospermum erythrorhizon]